jgi:hypothetical protein
MHLLEKFWIEECASVKPCVTQIADYIDQRIANVMEFPEATLKSC